MIYRYLVFSLVLAGAVIVMTLRNPADASGVVPSMKDESAKPGVRFSHLFHSEAGLACIDCHAGTTESMEASDVLWANHDACQSCHEEPLGAECGYCHTDPENIQGVTPAERTLLFPHAQHTAMDCQTCHAGMNMMEDFSANVFPSMESCYTCHNNQIASNTCETCHTDFVTLLPADHAQSDFLRSHRETIRLGGLEQNCQTCHVETFCQECHQGAGLKMFGEPDLMSDTRPKTSVRDNADQMTLQQVHELNYKFFHGIDAKSRQAECAGCHEPQTFCAECHAAGGLINQFRFKPASHSVAGFATIGSGSGGGLHAEEARRDMESCVSCHDVEGEDPTCMLCHTEGGKIR